MRKLAYFIGYIAGMCDRFGMLRARDALYDIPCAHCGARMDGFDSGVEV